MGFCFHLEFEATDDGYTFPFNDTPKGDFFEDDAVVTATAPGDEVPGFSLSASGVPPLETAMEFSFVWMTMGEEHSFTWTAKDAGKVQIAVRDGWHGEPLQRPRGLRGGGHWGSSLFPDPVVNKFNDLTGGDEVDYWWIARFDRDVAATANGPVELFVGSMVFRFQLD